MVEEKQIDRIEAWYAGRMNNSEKSKFEEELAEDEHLHQLFEKHIYLLDGFEGMKITAMAEKMRKVYPADTLSGKRRSVWATIAIAASLVILAGITYFIAQPTGIRQLANSLYAAPLAEVQRSGQPGEDSFFQKGMIAYSREDWDEAISAFSRIETNDPDYAGGLYFEAHAFVARKDYQKALEIFENPVFKNNLLQQQAEWNKVLMKMFLQYPDEKIRTELRDITNNPDHFYNHKAIEALNTIEKK